MWYNYFKALHLIFVITWFAGLFYIPRLFIYHIESLSKPDPEKTILSKQLKLMTKRLWYIITWPSAILTLLFGAILLVITPAWLQQGWMHIKLFFVFILMAYHLKTHQIFKQLQRNVVYYSGHFMRIYNEITTIVLFAIVFLVILKNSIDWVYGLIGLIVLIFLLLLGIKLYKQIRDKNPNAS